MIIIDEALRRRAEERRPIRVGLVGVGTMGRGILNQISHSTPGMEIAAIANRTPSHAVAACAEIDAGFIPITDNAAELCETDDIDVIIDATGAVEFGAQLALKAFECGKDVVSLNVELDATVGAVLNDRARRANVIYTLADGDQPGVQMNLWRFVKGIGMDPLVCGNIKGLQDADRTPATQRAFAEQWGQNPFMVTSFADGSKVSMEQACVANATGMQVERRGMRGGDFDGHVNELCSSGRYDIGKLRELGGVVDYIVGAQPAPGVFVLATNNDPRQRKKLELYKLGEGPLYCFYRPYHLCHFEVPFSVARVALFRDAVLQAQRPMVDVIAIAKRELTAGEPVDGIGGYMTYGQCEAHSVVRAEKLLPQGLAEGCVLKRDLHRDQAISYDDVELPPSRVCDRLRAEQDQACPA